MARAHILLPALILVLLAALPGSARANMLIADLSERRIGIEPTFTGAQITLFGAVTLTTPDGAPDPGGAYDIVVSVRGPSSLVTVRRKSRVAGIWVNRTAERFSDVPHYLYVASSRPLVQIADPTVILAQQLGVAAQRFGPAPMGSPRRARTERESFRRALIDTRVEEGLYIEKESAVTLLRPNLFRATVPLPANAPAGTYTVRVFLLRDGRIASAQSSRLEIERDGLERQVYELAHHFPFVYGVIAVTLALLLGWAGSFVFRRT